MWISVLEDEAVLNNLITKYLQKEGYSVRSYLRGEDAVQGLDKPTDLWVIDIMLPDIDGFTVFREVQRKNPNSYVIFISARNQDIDRLAGLELGGDDYISKPFLVRELVIKVQRLLKGGRPKTAEVQVGPYTVHLEKHLVYCGSESISLTVKEYDLLLYLAAHRGHVLKRGRHPGRRVGLYLLWLRPGGRRHDPPPAQEAARHRNQYALWPGLLPDGGET